jgi:hypothetical protein
MTCTYILGNFVFDCGKGLVHFIVRSYRKLVGEYHVRSITAASLGRSCQEDGCEASYY